jgi:AcrR family transcriptional regulator
MIASTAKRPRTKPAEIRREELMDAAQALFLEKGFAATSVDEIVKRADVAKGTFYLQFKTKEDVLVALRERFVATFCERLTEAMNGPPAGAWNDRLDAWIETVIHGYLDHVALHDLVFHEHVSAHLRIGHDDPVIAPLADLLAAGARHGVWTVKDANLSALMLFHSVHGAVDSVIVNRTPPERYALIEVVRGFCRQALGIRASTGR